MAKNKQKPPIPSPAVKNTLPARLSQGVNDLLVKAGLPNKLEQDEIARLEKDELMKHKFETTLAELIETKSSFEAKLADVARQEADVQANAEAVRQQRQSLAAERETVHQLQLSIGNQQQRLAKAELELEQARANHDEARLSAVAGFASEQRAALQTHRRELDELYRQHSADVESSLAEIERQKRVLLEREQMVLAKEAAAIAGFAELERKRFLEAESQITKKQEEFEQNLSQATAELEMRRQSLDQEQLSLAADRTRLAQEQRKLQLELQRQLGWEKSREEEIRQEFGLEQQNLQRQLKQSEHALLRTQNKVDELQQELLLFADLKGQLSECGVVNVQGEIDRLTRENRDLNARIAQRREDGLVEENERLQARLSALEEDLHDLSRKYEEADALLNNKKMSAQEKAHLIKEKRVLEEHNRLLDISIEELKSQLDDLQDRQQGALPFPALSAMDQRYQFKASGLQPVPENLRDFANNIRLGMAKRKLFFPIEAIRLFIAGLAMSRLHILQGISGTGKTSLARAFAAVINNALDETERDYCTMVRVQAGWRDREDLLGHFNAFEKKFYEKDALQAIYRAQQPRFSDTVQIILLDEMNLSQPEQYFAEFLSLMETPERAEISLLESPHEKSPVLFTEKRAIRFPQNVWFVGTANHDETTKEFADKTYDRAHVMEIAGRDKEDDFQGYEPVAYSFSSLQKSFDEVSKKGQVRVHAIFDALENSELRTALQDIRVGWGSRLRRHAERFIPVHMALGGTEAEALDHLLVTKVLRSGKVTGRYDTRTEQLERIESDLRAFWKAMKLDGEPVESLRLIRKDIEGKEQGDA